MMDVESFKEYKEFLEFKKLTELKNKGKAKEHVTEQPKQPKRYIAQIKLLYEDTVPPSSAHVTDAGLDIYSHQTVKIEAGSRKSIKTGIAIETPIGMYSRILSKSGLAKHNCIDIGAGVVDCGYRGEVEVLVINNGKNAYTVKKGKAIAQLVFQYYAIGNINMGLNITLSKSDRGSKGHGSSGLDPKKNK